MHACSKPRRKPPIPANRSMNLRVFWLLINKTSPCNSPNTSQSGTGNVPRLRTSLHSFPKVRDSVPNLFLFWVHIQRVPPTRFLQDMYGCWVGFTFRHELKSQLAWSALAFASRLKPTRSPAGMTRGQSKSVPASAAYKVRFSHMTRFALAESMRSRHAPSVMNLP